MSAPSTTTSPTTPVAAAELGAFCWIELHTRDRDAARAFFPKVIGWTIAPCVSTCTDCATMYDEWIAPDGARVGGMMEMPPQVPAFVPPSFATYVNVADVDATAARVPKLGGTVLMAPMDIPDVGRFAVIADPTGGVLNIFKGCGEHGAKSTKSLPGHFCWCELETPDPKAARDFYCALIGYSTTSMPMPSGEYTMFAKPGSDDGFVAGMMKCEADPAIKGPGAARWLAYVCVPNVDAAARAALSAGGTVLAQPSDVPGFGRSAVIADPTGAALGLFTPAA